MCAQFEVEVLTRSKIARERANLPQSALEIPNYRQLLHTSKFEHFHRCTCDKAKHDDEESVGGASSSKKSAIEHEKCKKHTQKKKKQPDSESESTSDSSSGASSYTSSTESEADTGGGDKAKKGKDPKAADEEVDEGFEDIRSMEMHRKQNHPERLHPNLSFNEPDQVNSINRK
jgi:hypothetical protein